MMASYSSTADAVRGTVWSLPRALSRLRPEACALLVALNERVWQVGDPVLLELIRLRVAQLISNPAALQVRCSYADAAAAPESKILALPDYPSSPLFSPAERDTLAFAEQFLIDVGGTTEDARAELIQHFCADRAKVALRVTDSFITQPDILSDALAGQARASFEPAELASLCLDITKWSTQKIHVALGTDGADGLETDNEGVAVFGFDETGRAT